MVILRQGSQGNPVKYLQVRLNARLYPNPKLLIDGRFGLKTRDAVERFQSANRLAVDGVVGPTTWAALAALSRLEAVGAVCWASTSR
jgi:peptidoglycan hydrolase-like protein with peptidoglycan-binding domain